MPGSIERSSGLVLGLTGPTGSGKTTVLQEIARMGGQTVDADQVYHQLLQENLALQQALEDRFGSLRGEDGGLDRKRLGNIVFRQPEALRHLNQLTRPYLKQALEGACEDAIRQAELVALDAVRLFESGLDRLCHVTLGILAPVELRVERIMQRDGISREYAMARVASQPPDEFFRSRCMYILENDGTDPRGVQQQAHDLVQQLLEHPPGERFANAMEECQI